MSLAEPAIASPYIHASVKRRKNVWYSLRDGNWNDPNTWTSNALAFSQFNFNYPSQAVPSPVLPALGDDVYINHSVLLNVNAVVANIRVSGYLSFSPGIKLTINGDLQAVGTIDMTGLNTNLWLYGVNNSVVNFISGTSSTVTYARNYESQFIMNLSYYNLTLQGITSTKYTIVDMTIQNTLLVNISTILDNGTYNLTVLGITSLVNGQIYGTGNFLFVGALSATGTIAGYIFGSSSIVEFRNGVAFDNFQGANRNFSCAQVIFTTNNQSMINAHSSYDIYFLCPVLISGAITVDFKASWNWIFSNDVNGDNIASKLYVSTGTVVFNYNSLYMRTGIFDYSSTGSAIGYTWDGDWSIPNGNYFSLIIGGTGAKTLTTDLILNGNLILNTSFDLQGFNLTVVNLIFQFLSKSGILLKSGAGSIIVNNISTNPSLNLSANPPVQISGGITFGISANFYTGTGTWRIMANQTFSGNAYIPQPVLFNCFLSIANSCTLTMSVISSIGGGIIVYGKIDGESSTSKLVNTGILQYQNAIMPMIMGLMDTSTSSNTFKYNLLGDQDIKGGTYRTLEFGGSGVKTLQGNVVVNTTAGGSWSITGSATINYNGYTITTI